MCYTWGKTEGGVVALLESDNTNFLKSNGQSRNLNIYGCVWRNNMQYCCKSDIQTNLKLFFRRHTRSRLDRILAKFWATTEDGYSELQNRGQIWAQQLKNLYICTNLLSLSTKTLNFRLELSASKPNGDKPGQLLSSYCRWVWIQIILNC